jgi:hypothetical protein
LVRADERKANAEIESLSAQLRASGDKDEFQCDKCKSMVSRMCGSILNSLDKHDFISSNFLDYKAIVFKAYNEKYPYSTSDYLDDQS